MSKLYVIDGLDGSGKGTITTRLQQHYHAAGITARRISFPNYESESGALVRMYLDGRLGGTPEDTGPHAASTMFAIYRYISDRCDWGDFYRDGDGIIIADRYTTANAVHQMTKIPQQQWDSFLDWLFDFEYNKLGLPAPDTVIYLDMLPHLSQRTITARSIAQNRTVDIHETDTSHLEKARRAGLYAAERFGWNVVASHQNGDLRSLDEVFDEILEKLD